jgi:hypothetical protein
MTTTTFWLWQSDYDTKFYRYFVRNALKYACNLVAIDLDCQETERAHHRYDCIIIPIIT